MAVVDVRNLEGKTVGQVELVDAVFAASVNPHLLHETVRWYLAGQRAGTHKTKGRGEVSGAGRKLWKQKGTGRARVGSIRSSIWRKGGTVHGPQPRDYSYRLPKKMVLGALRSALSAKLADEKLTVVDGWTLGSHKTKDFRQALSRLDGKTRTSLVVESAQNRNLELASRNLEGVKLVASSALQPYDLLRHERIMLSKDAALHLGRTLGPGSHAAPADKAGDLVAAPAPAQPPAAPKAVKPAAKAKTTKSAKPKVPRKAAAKPKAKE
jgi:large subunit ribosomal protein L4